MRKPRLRNNFARLARISLQNIGRNLVLSIATTVMLGLILFIFNVIMSLNAVTQSSLNQLSEKVDLLVYLYDSGSVYEVSELINSVEEMPGVLNVDYTSKEQALETFLSDYPGGSTAFTDFELTNPLPANLLIRTTDPTLHTGIVQQLQAGPYGQLLASIESSDENAEIALRLSKLTQFTNKLVIGVVITFIFGSVLMIINAIHLSIFTRKTEVQIMQLVGAKPNMIRFPFVFEGALYSIMAVLFSFILLILFLEGTQLTSLASFSENFQGLQLFLIEALVSLGVGILSSAIAVNYYLKRNFVLQHS